MPLTFDTVNQLCLASGYALSLFVGTPINVFVIYRLSSKDVPKTSYFRLLIFMCCIDIYQAISGELDFWGDMIFDGFPKSPGIRLVYAINGEVLTDTYNLQSFLNLIVVIYWKSVLKSKPKTDRFLSLAAIVYFTTVLISDIMYQYAPDITPLESHSFFDRVLFHLVNICEIGYLLLFSFITIYCIRAIRSVDTRTYSANTLKLYKRIALVHFIQCLFSMVEFTYHYIGTFVLAELELAANGKSKLIYQMDDIHYYTDLLYQITRPFIRAVFLAWALKRVLDRSGNPRHRESIFI